MRFIIQGKQSLDELEGKFNRIIEKLNLWGVTEVSGCNFYVTMYAPEGDKTTEIGIADPKTGDMIESVVFQSEKKLLKQKKASVSKLNIIKGDKAVSQQSAA